MSARFAVGIDLGTTNSVVAYSDLTQEDASIQLLPIPQLVAAGTVESRTSLPSFVYLATEQERSDGSFDLPWTTGQDYAVGELARRQSAEVPDRTIGAAKSWLCHSRVDRHQQILPWNAPAGVPQISPVTATQYFLEHLVQAWEHAHPEDPLRKQQVVLTVPASFDASARELTREAARSAGLPDDLVLLEEPQAAVYSWLERMGDRWRKQLTVGDVLLVCDIGGGTTDLSLVSVSEVDGSLQLERRAVGNHLLVGGDNMDLALSHQAAGLFAKQKVTLDPWQSVSLWHACRAAKETLLGDDAPKKHPVSVLGRGSRLIGGTVTVELDGKQAAELLADGFFPRCELTDAPVRQRVSGFQEIGLPYESDTGITRHLAAFLQAHGDEGEAVRPTHLLVNGGVFRAAKLRQRLHDVLADWFGKDSAPQPLEGPEDLDHAVARGAASYCRAKQCGGIRIRGGTARSYYVGIESAGLAVPGAPRPLRALCVVPAGMEEGTECDVPGHEVGLVVGEPAQFRFFSSSMRRDDVPGDVLATWSEEELGETDSLETTLDATDGQDENYVPVRFHARVTELGVLELWCASDRTDGRWKLEFSVRDDAEG